MIELKTYDFKQEFCPLIGITKYQMDRRKNDLLNWLKFFFNYKITGGSPITIAIYEQYEEYQPMPRKVDYEEEKKKKEEDYKTFTIAALGTNFKPNSKSKIARDAIDNFGRFRYNHNNIKAVVERYVKKPFDQYGETNNNKVWVWFSTYEPLNDQSLSEWRQILEKRKIAETEAANAFYKEQQGEDITKEKNAYKQALEDAKELFCDTPVLVKEWRAAVAIKETLDAPLLS